MLKISIIFLSLIYLISITRCQTVCRSQFSNKRMVCYFASWAATRASPGNMLPENFDPCLCTHVLYSFVPMANNQLNPSATDIDYFQRMNKWKSTNPNIKISISVGGWSEGSGNFNSITLNSANTNTFCQSVLTTVRKYNLDGFDIDWEYPTNTAAYTSFVQTCRSVFDQDSLQTGRPKLLLSAATAPDLGRMAVYDLKSLNNYFDFINPMTYDWHGPWDGNPSHHSPLYKNEGSSNTVNAYISGGISPSKLNLGLAAYGRSSSTSGAYLNTAGALAYFEICKSITNYNYDQSIQAPNALYSNQLVFFDDPTSIAAKANWAISSGVGGSFIWDASLDDFSGVFCGQGKFPLLNAAINVLSSAANAPPTTLAPTTIPTTNLSTTIPTTISTTIPTTTIPTTIAKTTLSTTIPTTTLSTQPITCNSKIFQSYPYDCAKFIKCNATTNSLVVADCPSGLLFNLGAQLCDWPANVKCTTQAPPTTTPATTQAATTVAGAASVAGAATTLAACDPNKFLRCVQPCGCNQFLKCDTTKGLVLSTCPSGLNFNVQNQQCDWPANVNCATNIG